MKYVSLEKLVSLRQGLAINKESKKYISNIKSTDYPYSLLRIADMISRTYEKYISKSINQNVIANQDDIIYTRTGQIGLVFRGYVGVVHNNCFIVSIIDNSITKDYLFCILKSTFVRQQAMKMAKSSVQPDLTHKMFKSIVIPVPSVSEQKKISDFILGVENKIDNNNFIIEKMNKMSNMIFEHWFLQYNYPNNSNTKKQYISKLDCDIPLGWQVKKIKEISKISAGGDKPKKFSDVKTKEFCTPIYSNGSENMGLYGYTDKATKPKNAITVSARGNIGYTVIRKEAYAPVIRLISIIPNEEYLTEYLASYISKYNFSKNGSIQQQLVVPQISDIDIIVPPDDLLKLYHGVTEDFFEKSYYLKLENEKLTKYKETLLPLLLNNQIKIKE